MKTGFFESGPGRKSSIRLQMLMTLVFSFLVIGYQVVVNENHVPDFLTMITLLTASFTPKLIQNVNVVVYSAANCVLSPITDKLPVR